MSTEALKIVLLKGKRLMQDFLQRFAQCFMCYIHCLVYFVCVLSFGAVESFGG